MTLLIAALDGENAWMVSDMAVSGLDVPTLQPEMLPKIRSSDDGRALIGFAGPADARVPYNGARIAADAGRLKAGEGAIRFLLDEHLRDNRGDERRIDFAYAFRDGEGTHLWRIAAGKAEPMQTFHIGDDQAFAHFQRLRHNPGLDAAPDAFKSFFFGARGSVAPPVPLTNAVVALTRLFAERLDRSVAGFALPYFLTHEDAVLCGYGYSVSDPIFSRIYPGSLVPHGTAEGGGYGLSITEISAKKAVVEYRLQQRHGTIYLPTERGFELRSYDGSPSEFIRAASAGIDAKVEIFFAETAPQGPLKGVSILHDDEGRPSAAIAHYQNSFTTSVINVGEPFYSKASLSLTGDHRNAPREDRAVSALLSEDKTSVRLTIVPRAGDGENSVTLTKEEMESLMAELATVRAAMSEGIALAPLSTPGMQESLVIDPAWRANEPPHAALRGIILRLRHPGFGWLSFLLPFAEARSLGGWLSEIGAKLEKRFADAQAPTDKPKESS